MGWTLGFSIPGLQYRYSVHIRDFTRGLNGLTHSICSINGRIFFFFLIIFVVRVRFTDVEVFLLLLHPDIPKLIQNDVFAKCLGMKI